MCILMSSATIHRSLTAKDLLISHSKMLCTLRECKCYARWSGGLDFANDCVCVCACVCVCVVCVCVCVCVCCHINSLSLCVCVACLCVWVCVCGQINTVCLCVCVCGHSVCGQVSRIFVCVCVCVFISRLLRHTRQCAASAQISSLPHTMATHTHTQTKKNEIK